MPFFNFRRGTSSSAATQAAPPDSLETLRRRAKHRLMGSVVLVLAGVVGFPLLFDTQPRPVAVDIPIEIPAKTASKPLVIPTPVAPDAPVAPAQPPKAAANNTPAKLAAGEKVAAATSLGPEEEIIQSKPAEAPVKTAVDAPKKEANSEPKVVVKIEPKAALKPEVKPEPKPEAKPSASEEAARARALLNGQLTGAKAAATPDNAEASGRLVVQVGAFADVLKAREVRVKLEAAGLKTYTQVAETKEGKRIRVRVGPFASRADADKAAGKIKTLGLPASVLNL
jgi:DedD protein